MDARKEHTSKKETIRKVFRYVGRYWYYLIGAIVLALVVVVLTLFGPILNGWAIDCILEKGAVDFERLAQIIKLIVIVMILNALAQWLMARCNNNLTFYVSRDIRNDLMDRIEILPFRFLDAKPTGDITSAMIADVDQFADGLLLGFTQLFTGVITIVGTLLFMFRQNVLIAFVVVVVTPLSLFVASFIAKRTYHLFTRQAFLRGKQTAYMDEIIQNQKVVKAYSHEDEAIATFDEMNREFEKVARKAVFFSSLTNPSTRFVNNIVYALVVAFGAMQVLAGRMSVGQLSCFLNYASQYTKPFNEISAVMAELQNAIACAARVFSLIEETPQIPESEHAVRLTDVKGHVSLDNVSFSYEPEQKLIEELNLDVEPGQRVAIVGPTGCGKTTLINLLMRFYDVTAGSIQVENVDIRNVTRESLRESYGMVLQETWLHAGTIRENISMGKKDATLEEVVAAAKAAHCHSFIKQLPQGYDTPMGEDGGGLSQGQRQLLCIARVMLCLPPMLILDEATSSIDTRTELKIQNAFAKMMEGRTSFIVAHRLSTIRNADIILVMKDGHIIEKGNHEQLLARNGFYAKLYYSGKMETEKA